VAASTTYDSTAPLLQCPDVLEAMACKAKARSTRGQEDHKANTMKFCPRGWGHSHGTASLIISKLPCTVHSACVIAADLAQCTHCGMQAARVICYVQSVVVCHSSLVLAIVIVTLTCH